MEKLFNFNLLSRGSLQVYQLMVQRAVWYSDLLVNSGDENGPCLEVGSVITVRSVSEVSCQFVFF